MAQFTDITHTIGQTPIVGLKRIGAGLPGELVLKLEFFNPFGSVKDRIALNMIDRAEFEGKLKPGMTVIEPTSGNTGISLAFICASRGYALTLVMPESMSQERRTLILLSGAHLILTPAKYGMKGAIARALEIAEAKGDGHYFMPRQFENPANPEIHQETTGLEIWRDTEGRVDFVVSGVGTGGTLTGVGTTLKNKKAGVKMIAVEPIESAVISGEKPGPHKIQGIGAGFIPQNLKTNLIDGIEKVSSEEAFAMAKRVIREEGIPVGISAGAAVVAGLRVAARPENKGKLIVAIIASHTERYLSTLLAEEERTRSLTLPIDEINESYLAKAGLPANA